MTQEIEVTFTLKTGEEIKYTTEINAEYSDKLTRNFLRSAAVDNYPNMIINSFSFRQEAEIYDLETKTDLFEDYKKLPQNVKTILDKYSEMDNTYEKCKELIKELENIGYTCDYGLDASPFELKKIL